MHVYSRNFFCLKLMADLSLSPTLADPPNKNCKKYASSRAFNKPPGWETEIFLGLSSVCKQINKCIARWKDICDQSLLMYRCKTWTVSKSMKERLHATKMWLYAECSSLISWMLDWQMERCWNWSTPRENCTENNYEKATPVLWTCHESKPFPKDINHGLNE